MTTAVKVLFATGSDPVVAQTLARFRQLFPELPLVVVSEFAPAEGEWIQYHIRRTWSDNYRQIRNRLRGRPIRLGAMILEPRTPHRRMRLLALTLAPLRLVAFNENGEHFRLAPGSLPTILRHLAWRGSNLARTLLRKGRRLTEPRLPILFRLAMLRGRWIALTRGSAGIRPLRQSERPRGVSVVIPSRNGKELLADCLALLEGASEIIVCDNGSNDGTADFLRGRYPAVVVLTADRPLSFARAVNSGIRAAHYSHVCLLNNDMLVEPGFLAALRRPFAEIPDLFSATAQIFFPQGRRREETGKTILRPETALQGLPVTCEEPLEGEDRSYVLYGSGGCTLYDAVKLEALGGFDEAYEPAYVEDLDIGMRAWLRGWPSVYCAPARVRHLHRATTSRYFSESELERALELNFFRFLIRAAPSRTLFSQLWRDGVLRLKVNKSAAILEAVARLPPAPVARGSCDFLALVNGDVAVFPGRPASGKPRVLVASPYVPFPLSHGAAVRIYNLMRRAARDFDQILVAFTETLASAPAELRDFCVEIVEVRRPGSHAPPSSQRPDTVEEFDSPSFRQALRQSMVKWKPAIAQLEFTQMAQYAPDCSPARTILVEHDITYDLYAQMLEREEDWEVRRQYERWKRFETQAWTSVSRVVTMSKLDQRMVDGSVVIQNGVDLERFKPGLRLPDPARLLFIGSFAHRPNVLALEFFLREVFPKLEGVTLHVIAGQRHERFWDLRHPGVEVEGFVSDVRPAYQRATLVIAPLVASAGTNIKIMEAMAVGKAIVSTPAGIHGLDLTSGEDLLVVETGDEMAAAIKRLLASPQERRAIEKKARDTAERLYDWDAIAAAQKQLYEEITGRTA